MSVTTTFRYKGVRTKLTITRSFVNDLSFNYIFTLFHPNNRTKTYCMYSNKNYTLSRTLNKLQQCIEEDAELRLLAKDSPPLEDL